MINAPPYRLHNYLKYLFIYYFLQSGNQFHMDSFFGQKSQQIKKQN